MPVSARCRVQGPLALAPDPVEAEGGEEEVMAVFRAVRDAIRRRVEELMVGLKSSQSDSERRT